MLIAVIIICAIFVVIVYFGRSTMFNFKHVKSQELNKYVECLLYRGADESFLIIKKERNKQFVQFKKTIVEKGKVDLYFSFPKVKWSYEYYDKIINILTSRNISFIKTSISDEDPIEFILANLNDDIEKCVELVKSIFDDAFEINSNINYSMKFSNISPLDVKIGY